MERKIRFGDLVRNSGRPTVATLWTDPKNDRSFAKAIKENRVLTVIQEKGNKKDYGRIGFQRHPTAAYFVFPRPLPQEGCIVGINYQLVEEPVVADPVQRKDLKPKPRGIMPVERKFTITVRRTATREDKFVVKALDEAAAEQRAVKAVKRKPFKADAAEVREEILKAE